MSPAPRRAGPEHGPDAGSRGAILDALRIVLAFVLPPAGVFLHLGACGQLWLNVALTLAGYVPGVIHAVYLVLTREPVAEPWSKRMPR